MSAVADRGGLDTRRRTASAVLERAATRLHVGGGWRPATGGRRESVDPSTGATIGAFGLGSEADVDEAVQAASAAQPAWRRRSLAERSDCLMALYEAVVPRVEELATCDAVDAGLPLGAMRAEVGFAAEQIRRWPAFATAAEGQVFDRDDGRLHYTTSAPYGVVARLIAYNHPTYSAICGMLPVLLAGNTLVLKPADHTPVSALLLAEIAADVLPPGVLNVVTGDAVTGRALVTHPLIERIAFTGSTETGLAVQAAASADRVRVVTSELGGKNPMVVFPDADVEAVAEGVIAGMNLTVTQGQSCASTSRVYVHADLHDELVDAVAARLRTLRIGIAYDDATTFGPMISREHAASVSGYVARAVEEGARAVSVDADPPEGGFFVPPTLLTGIRHEAAAAREEIFGPVVSVIPWEDEARVVEQANDTRYGLSASIWTGDLDRALSTVDRIEAGYVWVNCAGEFTWGTPFRGWKDSGIGEQESLAELVSYRRVKTVNVRLGGGRG
jgi:acyl-CoA reductase-like NAD-dependent aldehyde dehydrogenase